MSELRTVKLSEMNAIKLGLRDDKLYFKSEADKVIAEKDAEIAQLQAMLEERNKQVGELKDRIAPKQSDKTLQERLNEVCEKHGVSTLQDLDWAFCESEKRRTKDNINAANIIYHHKFKRCVAMSQEWRSYATFCGIQSSWYNNRGFGKTAEEYTWKECHAWRCVKRWLELAEKFKEAK